MTATLEATRGPDAPEPEPEQPVGGPPGGGDQPPVAKETPSGPAEERRGWVSRLFRSCRAHPGLTVLVALAAILGTGLTAVPPLFMRVGLNDAVAGRTDRILWIAVGLAVAGLLQFGGAFARQFWSAKLALAVQHDLRTGVFSSLQRLDGGKQDSLRTGQVMSRANIDLQMLQGLLAQAPMSLGSVVLVIIAFAAMIWISPLMTLIHVGMVFGCAVVTLWSSRRLSPATWAVQHRNAVLAQMIGESVAGVYVVKGFGRERFEVSRYATQARKLFGERMRVARMQSQPMATLQSLPLSGQIGVLLIGGSFAIAGSISLGDFVAFATFTTILTAPAGVLSNLVVAAQLTKPAVERVYELLDTHPDVTDAPDAAEVAEGPLDVAIDSVTFGYARDEPVLHNFSLHVGAGETVALVGPSGSGKSTVAVLLPRFYEVQEGSIAVGPAGAETDIRQLRMRSLRQRVGVVFEEPFLFSSTIAQNIAYGHPGASADEIEAAARSAGADDFIALLPQGYDTPVGENGSTLSGGQRQRIALARTLLSNPSVLVLDDATSAVDAATASTIQETMAAVAADHTTILIAHRRATLSLAQRIVVLDAGTVVDQGTYDELASRCSLFQELFGDQAESEASGEARPPLDQAHLWPDPQSLIDDESADVTLDGMEVARSQVAEVESLAPLKDEPEARLGEDPPPGQRQRRGLFGILRPVRGLVFFAVVLMGIDAAVTSIIPSLVRRGMDNGVSKHNLGVVYGSAAIALGVVLLNWFVLFWQPRVIARTGESALFAMRIRSFRHLHRLGLDHFQGEKAGALLTRMTTDITSLADFVESGLTVAAVNVLTIGVMTGAMFLLDPSLALWALAVMPVLVIATWVFRRLSGTAYEQTRDQIGEVNETLQENVEGLRTAQAHGQEQGAQDHFGGLSEALRKIRLKAQSYAAAYFPFVALLSDVSTILVLAVGVRRVADGSLSPGVLTAFLLYLGLFYAPFQQLSIIFDGYQRAKVAANRIDQLFDTPVAIAPPSHPVALAERLHGEVRFHDVGYAYANSDEPALSGISLTVRAGERVALVGATGSGKSTLVKLVARLYDATAGRVEVDGEDVRNYDLEGYRQRLGVVPQEAHLFTGSVADNIRYGRPDASDAEVQEAARSVGALPMIAGLAHGFQQLVGEGGTGLSTGQLQLVALARARLADPDILLLDEPTASLDASSEQAVLRAMDELASSRTTFLVTHRLASAERADRILVMDAGRLVEDGTHAELIALGGRYARLWELDRGTDSAESVAVAVDKLPLGGMAMVGAWTVQLTTLARQLVIWLTSRWRGRARRRSTSAAAAAPAGESPPAAE